LIKLHKKSIKNAHNIFSNISTYFIYIHLKPRSVMKSLRFLFYGLLLVIGITGYSQVSVIPQGFNYQAISRDLSGNPLVNQQINLRFTITDQSGTQIPYAETHSKTTNPFGLFTAIIGQGTPAGGTGTFSQIDWKSCYYYLKTEIQEGMNYNEIGFEPLLSVPYAMYTQRAIYTDHADTSSTNELQDLALTGDDLSITNGNSVNLYAYLDNTDHQTISLAGNNLSISNGNTIDISSIIPTGSIMPYAGTAAPAGWLFCDGTLYSTSQYPDLYTTIETSYGGISGTNFNVPDFRGRFLRGVDGTAGNDPDNSNRTSSNPGGNTGNSVGSLQDAATALPVTNFSSDTQGNHQHSSNGISVTTQLSGDHQHGPGTLSGATSTEGLHSHAYTYWRTGAGGSYEGAGSIAAQNITSSAGSHYHAVYLSSGSTTATGNHSHTATITGNTEAAGSHSHIISAGGDNETRPQNVYVNYIIKY
jgi:hypothetical protein